MEIGRQTMQIYANGYMYACIHSNMREEQHETDKKYSVTLEFGDEEAYQMWMNIIELWQHCLGCLETADYAAEDWQWLNERARGVIQNDE